MVINLSRLLNPVVLIILGLGIAFIRISAIQHHGLTGEKLIHPTLMHIGLWTQYIFMGLGVGIWDSERRRQRKFKKYLKKS